MLGLDEISDYVEGTAVHRKGDEMQRAGVEGNAILPVFPPDRDLAPFE
jgi:hypothetical protein